MSDPVRELLSDPALLDKVLGDEKLRSLVFQGLHSFSPDSMQAMDFQTMLQLTQQRPYMDEDRPLWNVPQERSFSFGGGALKYHPDGTKEEAYGIKPLGREGAQFRYERKW